MKISRLLIHAEICFDTTGTIDDLNVFVEVENDDGIETNMIYSGLYRERETHEEIKNILSDYSKKNIPIVFDSTCDNKWEKFAGSNSQLDDSTGSTLGQKALYILIFLSIWALFAFVGSKVVSYLEWALK